MNNSQASLFIGLLAPIIIGIIAVTIIGNQIVTQTSTTAIVDDQFTAGAIDVCTRVTNHCFLSGTGVIENGTAGSSDLATGNFTQCGADQDLYGFAFNTTGTASQHHNGETMNATYTQIDCAYIEGSLSRMIVNYIPILAVLVLFVGLAVAGGLTRG